MGPRKFIDPEIEERLTEINRENFRKYLNERNAELRCPCCGGDSFYIPQNTGASDGGKVHFRYNVSSLYDERGSWGITYGFICNNCSYIISFCAHPILNWMFNTPERSRCDG